MSNLPNKIIRLSKELVFTIVDDYPSEGIIATFEITIKEQLEHASVYLIEDKSGEVTTRLALFDVDDILQYMPFAHDHGPLNMGMVSRFGEYATCIAIDRSATYGPSSHTAELLQAMRRHEKLAGAQLCLMTIDNPDTKSNAACLAAVYTVRRYRISRLASRF